MAATTDEPLKTTLIADRSLVRLYMRIGQRQLECMLYNPYEDRSLIYRKIEFENQGENRVRALENAIYDNPLLLEGDFAEIAIAIDTPRVALIPSQAGDAEDVFRLWHNGSATSDMVFTVTPPGIDATLAAAVDRQLWNFVRRTFATAQITHPLATLITYGRAKSAGASPKMFVNLHDDTLETVVTSGSRLFEATRFSASLTNDAAFYLLSMMSLKGQEPEEVYVAGDSQRRRELIESLRRFHPYVMPLIFPSEMHRAGANGEGMSFDLVIMPLIK